MNALPLENVPVVGCEKKLKPDPFPSKCEPVPIPDVPLPINATVKSTSLIFVPFTFKRKTPVSPSPKENGG